MRILVTGAEGMLGKDVVSTLKGRHEVLGLGHAACDITRESDLSRVFREWRPEAVIHCAAYTDVDGCERDRERAWEVNARGAQNVAGAAERAGARVFYISTDYVFDGSRQEPYREQDATAPVNYYGVTKLEGERQTLREESGGAGHLVIRTSWLFGLSRPNFVEKTIADAQSRPQLQVVADQVSCPTWTLHLAGKIAELLARPATGILHVVNGGGCSRYEQAQAIVEKLPRPVPVAPMEWSQLNRPARRPRYSVLGCRRLAELGFAPLPHWREALDDYLRLRQTVPVAASSS